MKNINQYNCVYYCFYGDFRYKELLELSVNSLNKFISKENIFVFSEYDIPELQIYCNVIKTEFPQTHAKRMAYRLILGKELLKNYDRVLHLDVDTLVLDNIDDIFISFEDGKLSFATEDLENPHKITGSFWAGPLLNEDELVKYSNVNSICCGVFGFNKSAYKILEDIYKFIVECEDSGFYGSHVDQHGFVTYVLRNNLYNYNLQQHVSHFPSSILDKTKFKIYHFAGGVVSDNKYNYMKKFLIQTIDNRNNLLDFLPKNLKIAELGIFKGDFSKIILEKLLPSELFLVDIFPENMCSGDKDGNNIVFLNLSEMYDQILKEFKDFDNVKIVRSYTLDFLNSLEDEYLDAVYIDADHTYEAVKKDLELSFRKVKTGGIIMGHDYSDIMFPDVVKAVDEFCNNMGLQISYLTNDGCPTYLIYKTLNDKTL
jgi:lipopolysaccharide biosynthesis glycosyltransferase